MAVTTVPHDVNYQVRLNNGMKPDGSISLVNVSLGKLSVQRYNANDAYALQDALMPLLAKTIHRGEVTKRGQVART